MSQFDVFRNPFQQRIGYLLDVQSDLFDEMASRAVVPLFPIGRIPVIVPRLNPVFRIRGRLYVMVTQQIAGTARTNLGRVAANLSQERDRIVAAIDLLVTDI